MSFLNRYEFERVLDEDLAIRRNQWQAETEKENVFQPQSSTVTSNRLWVKLTPTNFKTCQPSSAKGQVWMSDNFDELFIDCGNI